MFNDNNNDNYNFKNNNTKSNSLVYLVHDVQQYRTGDFDLSHRIRHLSFGINIPGKTNPFDGTELRTEKGPKSINYYIKIVPTTYERVDGSTLLTNQFSITQHQKVCAGKSLLCNLLCKSISIVKERVCCVRMFRFLL